MRRTIKQIAPSLSTKTKEIILGSLLGDGYLKIHPGYANARFSFRHSIKQKEYFFWKVKNLKEISSEKNCWEQKDGKLRYQSLAKENLTEIYEFTHKRNKFSIRRKWLNLLTPLSLAVWWMDDGSLVRNARQGVLCTDGFDFKAQQTLALYLLKVWKVNVKIGKTKKDGGYYRLWFRSTEELKKFFRIILPYVDVASMLPKFIILYKDSYFQQRWISEVSELSGFTMGTIKKYLEIKKSKYKNFRK